MHYTVAGGRLPSGLSTFQARKHAKDYWSADPPAWSLRMTRRLRALLLSVLLTIYLIYYLNIFPLSHVVAVLADADHQVKSNTTIGESPAGRTTPTATKYQPVAVTRVSTVTATATVHSISRVIKFDEQAVEQLERHKAQDKDAFINSMIAARDTSGQSLISAHRHTVDRHKRRLRRAIPLQPVQLRAHQMEPQRRHIVSIHRRRLWRQPQRRPVLSPRRNRSRRLPHPPQGLSSLPDSHSRLPHEILSAV